MHADDSHSKETMMMSIFEVFEKMYYIFLEPAEWECSDEPRRVVQIQFSGTLGGELHVYYSEALAETMIENALSMDKEQITDQIMEDCLKECINMICGNFLQKIEPDKVLQLSIPRYAGKASVPREGDARQLIHLAFESDGMAFNAVLAFKNTNT